MNNLAQEIQAAFQAISLILVFVTVFFGLRYSRIREHLGETIPAGPEARKQLRRKLAESLLINCAPLLLINGITSYLFAPLFVQVLKESNFELWDFSFTYTSFIFIALLVFIFFLWAGYLAVQLVRRIIKSQ